MTFQGNCREDLKAITAVFPHIFTVREAMEHCQLTRSRVAQALVHGQQIETIRLLKNVLNPTTERMEAIYEIATFRQKWLKQPWRSHGTLASRPEAQG